MHFGGVAVFCFVKQKYILFVYTKPKKRRDVTDRSGHGRREGAIVHVGVVHVAHHDVARVALVRMPFTVQVLEFS